MSLADDLNGNLPIGWYISHLIFLNPEWQVNTTDNEYVTIATGDSIEQALQAVVDKILCGDPTKRPAKLLHAYREESKAPQRSRPAFLDALLRKPAIEFDRGGL